MITEFSYEETFDVILELVNEWECKFKINNRNTDGTIYTRLSGTIGFAGAIKFVPDEVGACDINIQDAYKLSNLLNEIQIKSEHMMRMKQQGRK